MNNFYLPVHLVTKENIHDLYRGVLHGIWCFSWMKNGESFVGSGSKTLTTAKAEVTAEYVSHLKRLGIEPWEENVNI